MTDDKRDGADEVTISLDDPEFWVEALGGAATARWLTNDPEVSALIRAGRRGELYRLLQKKRNATPTLPEKEALERVLANRRLFLEPIEGGPGLQTFNGIGTYLAGTQEKAPDGTYISTLFFMLVFVPLWPIRQYLVAQAEGGGWFFLGGVPLSTMHRWWRRITVGALAATAMIVGLSLHHRTTHDRVHFLNGLDLPVVIRMGEHEIRVPSQGRLERQFTAGAYDIVTHLEDGTLVEERRVHVPGDVDFAAYNVLGAAPLFLQQVPYTAEGAPAHLAEESSKFRSLAGRSWVQWDDVDFLFQDPPSEIQMAKTRRIETRACVDVVPGGWRMAVEHLAGTDDMADAAAVAGRVADLHPGDGETVSLAARIAELLGDLDGARRRLERALEIAPDEIQVHRHYQSAMQRWGRADEILPRYRAAYEKAPNSPRAAYLLARLLPRQEAIPLCERLLASHPEDEWLRRSLAWSLFQDARYAEAADEYQVLTDLLPEERGAFASEYVRALAGSGRTDEAIRYVTAILDDGPNRTARGEDPLAGGNWEELFVLYAALRRGAEDPTKHPSLRDLWIRLLDDTEPEASDMAWVAAAAGDETLARAGVRAGFDPGSAKVIEITLLARTDVERAAAMAGALSTEAVQQLRPLTRVAVACELDRRGNEDQARAALENITHSLSVRFDYDLVHALPDLAGVDDDLGIEVKAALLYAASRRVKDEARREALLAQARTLDVLHRVVPD